MIATPRYDDTVIAASYMAKHNAARNEDHPEEDAVEVVFEVGVKGSLLPYCFNQCLAEALNQRDAGKVTHLAFIHADIACDPGWLNKLWSIARRRRDVVVSAVVSIKETARLRTSTAVGRRTDKFGVKRFINTTDRPGMPETFSTRDLMDDDDVVLLVNTGLMLADIRHEFWDSFSFGFDDVIARDQETGRRVAQACSEDWRMSRALDASGVPYAATWAIPVFHTGPSTWCSHDIPAAT
jgi:hypothetical protein